MREFHVSRVVRDRYQFDQSLFSLEGNVIFANFHAARVFAQKINQKRDLINFPERAVKAGNLNGMGMIDEILHQVISLYRQQKNPRVLPQALAWLENKYGTAEVQKTLTLFVNSFPPVAVYNREKTAEQYLQESTDSEPNREAVLEEMLMLWITNKNTAFSSYLELFNDEPLKQETAYVKVMLELHTFFDSQPPFGPEQQNLIDMLRSPALAVPYSISGQLEYIRTRWSELMGQYLSRLLYRLLSSLDLIKEEEKPFFGGGPGIIPIPVYGPGAEAEPEAFSPDREWMPHLVLLAKNTYVWLGQLSKKYQRSITHLDQIPDEELEYLARGGFTGLWLIGLWERSTASATIKQLCGNPDAISSAYSLAGYDIAADLGGESAYQVLHDRAAAHGIRLASDMVPNHMGIDSNWVMEHPDWFVSLDHSPFPSYTFNGPDLSSNPDICLQIDDHYYSQSDAAVVFRRLDKRNGDNRFIYHGNDGTSMPWNDTAQLNYLKPEVREAVIQTILHVARKFPIIRFDAAMTLAKRHYQRLWYPEPGSGGDIPSRAEFGMSKDQFNAAMPVEFWREVVDRVAQEAPDTLLLAEAFWLMEGYFVRTLGMHRVYNSAFMNMLRNEDNAKYRSVIKNTLEFEPEVMKRFVNFMNNPDERTSVDQFGKGDKYFGTCVMLSTLPGLPMFGHGQIEGYSEKYGMEFRRALWDENPDPYLVARHEREIYPLLHLRSLFAGVEQFLMYDFFNPHGSVNEDVYAYSNGIGNDRALVIYHNKFASTSGWVRTSVGFLSHTPTGEKRVIQRTLSEGLNLYAHENSYVIFRDQINGLEFIRPSREMVDNGLYLELNAYEYHVFLNFRQVTDDEWSTYRQLCEYLGGRGVPSIKDALAELILQPVQQPFHQIANPGYLNYLLGQVSAPGVSLPDGLLEEARQKMSTLLRGTEALLPVSPDNALLDETARRLEWILSLPEIEKRLSFTGLKKLPRAIKYLKSGFKNESKRKFLTLFSWTFTASLGKIQEPEAFENQSLSWLDEWQFNKILTRAYQETGMDEGKAAWTLQTLRILIGQQRWFEQNKGLPIIHIYERWLSDQDIQTFIRINRYQNALWFNKESFEEFVWWMFVVSVLSACTDARSSASQVIEQILISYDIVQKLLKAEKHSGFQIGRLTMLLEKA